MPWLGGGTAPYLGHLLERGMSVMSVGAVGDGVADDTTAIQSAFTSMAALTPPGTVYFPPGVYKVTSSLTCACNINEDGAQITYSGSTTDPALTIGSASSGVFVEHLRCEVPAIIRATRSWGTVGTADVGLRLINLDASIVFVRFVKDFTANLQVRGNGTGSSYNTIHLGELLNGKVNLHCTSLAASDWSNENTYIGGRLNHDGGLGSNLSGCRHILLDCALTASPPNGNKFIGQSVEGNAPEYQLETKPATDNIFLGLRWECSPPKVSWNEVVTAGYYSQRNLILAGYDVDTIVQTFSTNSIGNSIWTPARISQSGNNPVMLEDRGGSDHGALVLLDPGGFARGDSPTTAYGASHAADGSKWKFYTDTAPRVTIQSFEFGKPAVGFGTGGSAVTRLIGGDAVDLSPSLSFDGGTNWSRIAADQFLTLTYSASITPTLISGNRFKITATNGTAFTINAPTNPRTGASCTFDILNSSGGALGVITWNAVFLLAGAFTNPASTKRRTISFYYDGTSWVETSRAAADI